MYFFINDSMNAILNALYFVFLYFEFYLVLIKKSKINNNPKLNQK